MSINIENPTAIALNERGARTAVALGLQVTIGKPAEFLDEHWTSGQPLVLVMALPIVVRLLARRTLLKSEDPAIVVVDESGQFIISVLGGHKGANRLASELAKRGGGAAVITTPSDYSSVAAIDGLTGFIAQGDIAKLIESMLEGATPAIRKDIAWPSPIKFSHGDGPAKIVISDRISALESSASLSVQLIPPSLVVGVGCSSEASVEDVSNLISMACLKHDLDPRAISLMATVDTRASHPSLRGQNIPLLSFRSEELAAVAAPNPSDEVNSYVGTPSVCEAAALLASGSSELLVPKTKNAVATVAIARRQARGHLRLVGLGPGTPMLRTPAAVQALANSEIVIGYSPYVDQCQELLSSHQLVIRSPIGEESERAGRAIRYALEGRPVALVCSGDPEVYAMASITLEKLEALHEKLQTSPYPGLIDLSVVPGITAGLGGGALLGAPLGHDHAYISLSDLLTPWRTVEKRLRAFGEADVVTVIYNPKSQGRKWQLPRAIEILASYRPSSTPVAIVKNVGRAGQQKKIYTIADFDSADADMTSLVIVGSATTRRFGDYILTPRGYEI